MNAARQFYTAQELADFRLPGLPTTKWRVILRGARENWLWRDREGRGGGREYSVDALPVAAQIALRKRLAPAAEIPAPGTELWRRFERLPAKQKSHAQRRLEIVIAVETLFQSGFSREAAVAAAAIQYEAGASSIYEWLGIVRRVDRGDWLPALAPRYRGRALKSECSPEAWEFLKSDYLRVEKPNFSDCYYRARRAAAEHGWALPSERTMLRRMQAIAPAARVHAREGAEAAKRLYPAQERDRSMFHALQAVNADGHRWDVWVEWPDGEIARPQMVAFQDLYSNKFLCWRVDRTLHGGLVRLAFGDLVERYGIPEHCWFDNGREFANKWLTGGASRRFRFKIREEDPRGILAQMGVQVHWTQPYSGQSKPIERGFKDFAQNIAKHPAFAGAYTGNSPVDKPENYRSRAIPLDRFLAILDEEIAAHNARPGRVTRIAQGRSFDEVFAASYEVSEIRKADPENRRLWLLAADNLGVSRVDGAVKLMGNRYWAEFLTLHRGQRLTARFDPERLRDGLHIYDAEDRYLGHAGIVEAVGFASVAEAREQARNRNLFQRATRDRAEAEKKLAPAEIVKLLPKMQRAAAPEASVIRLARPARDLRRRIERNVTPEQDAKRDALIAEFRRPAPGPADERSEGDKRFAEAMRIEAALGAGGTVGTGEAEWLQRYRETPEYRARARMREGFGQASA